jgi:ferredoxin
MRKTPGSRKLKAHIIAEDCKGCGVCIVGCKQEAMRYEIARPQEYITSYQFRPPLPQPVQEPGKPTRKVVVGAYGGYYELQ